MIKKRDLAFIVPAVAVVAFLAYLSTRGQERFIPRIPPHVAAIGIEDRAQADAYCFSCHNPAAPKDGAPPMPPLVKETDKTPAPTMGNEGAGGKKHPIRTKNCRLCHRLERKK
ncbi:MAG TPA: hypothetical protein VGK27_02720 [Candidatus Deferrimicrobiaceae bacterium]|jgi:hypothetical protein